MQSFNVAETAPQLALVSLELRGSESLYPRLLARAVREAGASVALHPIHHHREGPATLRAALRGQPPVLAFELTYPSSSLYELSLAALARKWGYGGTIVCYGTHATLAADWVLDRTPAVDLVLRQDPVQSMPQLLRALAEDTSIHEVPAVTSRQRVTPLAAQPRENVWRPERGPRPTIMGVPMAELIGSKGCFHRCDYCNHAAKQDHAAHERRRLQTVSHSHEVRKARPLDDLCDEMAELYHADGVRYFHLVDPLPVPPHERQAIEWARDFRAQLSARGVDDASLGFNTRGDGLSRELVDALVDLGLRRTLCGVESTSAEGLSDLGRVRHAGDPEGGLRRLVERGVVVVFNNLLLHPETTLDSIRTELQGLRRVQGALFDTIKLRLFPGTRAQQTWVSRNRTVGGELIADFTFDDPRVARFSRLCDRFRATCLGAADPVCRLNDLWFSVVLARAHAGSERPGTRLQREARALVDALNAARLDTLDALLHVTEQELEADAPLRAARERFRALGRRMDALETSLTRSDTARTYRNLAATASLVFALANDGGCTRSHLPGEAGYASGPDAGGVPTLVGPPGSWPPGVDGSSASDAGPIADVGLPQPSDAASDADMPPDARAEDQYWEARERLEALAQEHCDFFEQFSPTRITLDDKGRVVEVDLFDASRLPDGGLHDDDRMLLQCLEETLQSEQFPPLAGESITIHPVIVLL